LEFAYKSSPKGAAGTVQSNPHSPRRGLLPCGLLVPQLKLRATFGCAVGAAN
jgi:hypothetical protein